MTLIDIEMDSRIPQTLSAMLGETFVERMLSDVAAGARNEWIRLARQRLHSSKEAYVDGIQPVEVLPRMRVIALVGWLPNAIENGAEPYDMRETLLGPGSTIRRQGKKGAYASVPFRHGTPGSRGQSGTPMGAAYGPTHSGSRRAGDLMSPQGARELGTRIYDMAKRLSPTKVGQGQRTRWGERLPAGFAPLLRGANPAHPDPRMRQGHKTDIYAGMVRERHTYEKATQTQYMTWRTISEASPQGWIHPGIEAHHLVDQVSAYVDRIVPRVISAAVDAALKRGHGASR